ncbi:MAG: Flp family type IVb pilin [Phenylobacterium sp.]
MKAFLKTFLADSSGATAIEYGLIAALIAVVIIGSVGAVGTSVRDMLFAKVVAVLP